MRQVCFPRGGFAAGQWEQRFNYNGSLLERLPLPAARPVDLAQQMQRLTDTMVSLSPAAIIARWSLVDPTAPDAPQLWPTLKRALEEAEASWKSGQQQRIALQEEIDWQAYSLYSLLDADLTHGKPLPPISLGERPFEIALARRVAAGEVTTTWFERHGSTPITDIPAHWPADYRALIQKRLDAICTNPNIKLIEQPEYKRRWNSESWQDRQANALEGFLLDRLERFFDHDGRMNDSGVPTATLPIGLVSIGDLATAARRDGLFIDAAEVFTGDVAFDVTALVAQLVDQESVPLLPVQRYKDTGVRKHAEWQGVWEMQRQEDALDARTELEAKHPQHLTPEQAQEQKQKDVGDIAVPPKYTSADFLKNRFWSLRGKLDVPKERFVTFPGVTGPDGTAVIAWTGLDHLQLAKSIGDFYGMVQTEYGGSDDPRLVPLLANLSELLPWVKQWHPENLPDYGGPPAGFYEQFIRDEAASRGLTWADVREWTPPAATRAKRAAKKAVKRATKRVKGKTPGNEDPAANDDEEGEA